MSDSILLPNCEKMLKTKINDFLVKTMKFENKDYYSDMTIEQLFAMKEAYKAVNNVITYKYTLACAEWLGKYFSLPISECEVMKKKVIETNPNANGFDIQFEGTKKILVEVKCNIPVDREKKIFGAEQEKGILKDIKGLIVGKKNFSDTSDYYKFMVFPFIYDTVFAVHNVLAKHINEYNIEYIFEEKPPTINKSRIYVTFIKL